MTCLTDHIIIAGLTEITNDTSMPPRYRALVRLAIAELAARALRIEATKPVRMLNQEGAEP